jgi:hypothetical protein
MLFDFLYQDGPFHRREISGCPQIDKFATYSMGNIVENKRSPRIGILGPATYPQDEAISKIEEGSAFASQMQSHMQSNMPSHIQSHMQSAIVSNNSHGSNIDGKIMSTSQLINGRIDDVSSSVSQ